MAELVPEHTSLSQQVGQKERIAAMLPEAENSLKELQAMRSSAFISTFPPTSIPIPLPLAQPASPCFPSTA